MERKGISRKRERKRIGGKRMGRGGIEAGGKYMGKGKGIALQGRGRKRVRSRIEGRQMGDRNGSQRKIDERMTATVALRGVQAV